MSATSVFRLAGPNKAKNAVKTKTIFPFRKPWNELNKQQKKANKQGKLSFILKFIDA
jgi:hypothetical protein